MATVINDEWIVNTKATKYLETDVSSKQQEAKGDGYPCRKYSLEKFSLDD